jgi:hypothetical protein
MSDNLPAQPAQNGGDIIEQVITKGDLAKLTPLERVTYYKHVCESVGLNPLTRPFEYLALSGRLVLYARRDAADQLRKVHGISLEVVDRKMVGDLLIVTVRARDRTGRTDEDMGAVTVAGLKGEALANAMLKCTTKAKRRVTLSICGLGMLDETEVADVTEPAPPLSTAGQLDAFAAPQDHLMPVEPPPNVSAQLDLAHDVFGELDRAAKTAAGNGVAEFRGWWKKLSRDDRDLLQPMQPEYEHLAHEADSH